MSRRGVLQGAAVGGLGLAFGGSLAACGGANDPDGASTGTPATADEGEVVKGGRLRVGIIGGGNTESLDFNHSAGDMDLARAVNLYEGLTDVDPKGRTVNVLAEEMVPNKDASVWTIRVRDGVLFHDGKTLDADDVVYSLRYILDPKNKANGAGTLADIDPNGIRRRDAKTLEVRLKRPNSFLPTVMTDRTVKIFAADGTFDPPNGTGPFKFDSWTRGERSLFLRHADYRDGLPYLDELELISINDPNSRVNALQSKQVDALSQLDLTLVDSISNDPSLQLLETVGANFTAQMFEVDKEPFADVRVRQAMCYACDREQMLENVLRGRGRLGNDLPSWFDVDYAKRHPAARARPGARAVAAARGGARLDQRHPAHLRRRAGDARVLDALRRAGEGVGDRREDQEVPDRPVLRDHVPQGAVRGDQLGRPPAGQPDQRRLPPDVAVQRDALSTTTSSRSIIGRAFATTDEDRRRALMLDAQQIMWERGGTIIWGFLPILDALCRQRPRDRGERDPQPRQLRLPAGVAGGLSGAAARR